MSSVHSQTSKTLVGGTVAPRGGFIGQVTASLGRSLDLILVWQQRANERSHLASLSEHHLKDIGISRADVAGETTKPFWRP